MYKFILIIFFYSKNTQFISYWTCYSISVNKFSMHHNLKSFNETPLSSRWENTWNFFLLNRVPRHSSWHLKFDGKAGALLTRIRPHSSIRWLEVFFWSKVLARCQEMTAKKVRQNGRRRYSLDRERKQRGMSRSQYSGVINIDSARLCKHWILLDSERRAGDEVIVWVDLGTTRKKIHPEYERPNEHLEKWPNF